MSNINVAQAPKNKNLGLAPSMGLPSRDALGSGDATFTQQQRMATDPGVSARVMANAGAGKTYVLTARVLRLLLKGVHPGKILCLTYTKAAASEMRARINAQLQRWVLMGDAELKAELAELIEAPADEKQVAIARKLFSTTLESSPPPRIQTIHSFCQDVLRRFPLESGIQPYFEVADEVTSKELIKQTTQALLARQRQKPEVGAAIDFIAAEGGEWKFNEVIGEIISQRNRIRDLFDIGAPEEIIAGLYARENVERGFAPEGLKHDFMQFGGEKIAALKNLLAAWGNSGGKIDAENVQKLSEAIAVRDFGKYKNVFFTKENEPRAQRSVISQKALTAFAEGWEWILHEQAAIAEVDEVLNVYENLEFTSHVVYLAYGILETYENLKRANALIDYNDLIYSTKKLLSGSGNAAWVLYKLDGGLEHILVDEAQDTSPDQWEIILALLDEFMAGEGAAENERTVFIVGDEKQSIYSFQGADQKKFNEVVALVQEKLVAAQKPFKDIGLNMSFRSVAAVLKLADTTFQPEHLRKAVSSSPREISHLLKRAGEGGHVEIWPLIKNEDRQELENWQLPVSYHTAKSADLLLAENISDVIAGWIESGRKLVAENRAVRPSDILILLRSRGNLADMLINRLKRRKIPVSGSDRLKITEHIAVQDLLALGNFLLLPADDLSLASVLKSPLFGISEEELFELSYKREGSLWNSLRGNKKFQHIENEMVELLNKVDFIPVYDLFSFALDGLGGRKKLISRLGHEVNDVLDEFLDLAVNFEKNHTSSMQHFLSWVQLSSMEIKRDMEQGSGQVRIMTVHGAKGLEAPIVFIADAAKMPQSKRQLVWNKPHFYSYKTKSRLFAGLRQSVEAAEAADYEEYLRLLYVAITRARDELYVCGSLGEKNTNIDGSWYRIVEDALGKFGVKDEASGIIKYETKHENQTDEYAEPPVKVKTALPEFLHRKVAAEKAEVVELDDEVEFNEMAEQIDYGNKVHKVLEIAGSISADKRSGYIDTVFAGDIKTTENLKTLFTQFPEIFGANARSEVPVIGRVDGQVVSGRIDRLVVKDSEVMIVDFKTARNIPAQMPESYRKQMDIYAKIITPQFPGRKIRKIILWTSALKLSELA